MQFSNLDTLRTRGTRKWTQFDDDVIPMFVAESDFPTAPEVKQAIIDACEREMFGYTPAPHAHHLGKACLLYTSPSPRDRQKSRMPSSA